MARLRFNGLVAELGGSGLTFSGTSVTFAAALTHSGGVAVPTLTGSDFIPLSILDADGNLSEIVHLTAYTEGATTGTIVRAQEGTTGSSHDLGVAVVESATALDLTGNVLIEDGGTYPTRADDTIPALFIGTTDPGPDGLDIMEEGDGWADISGTDDLAAHIADAVGAHAASAISFTPAGTIAATDVQAALAELDTEKAALASPALTGTPTVPTAAPGTNTTQAASTAFVNTAVTAGGGYTDENARDAIGAALVEGAGIDITVSDGSDTITIAATGGGGGSVATDTIFDAKGDLAVGTGADTAAKLTVGSNGKMLVADSTQTTGLAYVNPGGVLAVVTYNPGTISSVTIASTTVTDVDATNLAITFTVPASGKVLVTAEALVTAPGTTSNSLNWALRESTTTVAGPVFVVGFQSVENARGHVTFLITGLTPGDSKTYKLAHSRTGSGTATTHSGGVAGPTVLVVTAVP